MQILFSQLKPYKRHQIKLTDKHELYVDEAGNVVGIPILFVHGGPGRILHGRYDMVCHLGNALALHRHWPDAELHIVRKSGHSASGPGTVDALIRATQDIANKLEVFD